MQTYTLHAPTSLAHRWCGSLQSTHAGKQPRGALGQPRGCRACKCRLTAGQDTGPLASRGLPHPPVLPSPPRTMFNPVTLAYLGDSIWEVLVRQHVWEQLHATATPPSHNRARRPAQPATHGPTPRQLHEAAAKWSNATQQAELHDLLTCASTATHRGSPAATDATATTPPTTSQVATSPSSLEPHGGMSAPPGRPHQSGFQLTADELDVLRWARNSSQLTPPGNVDSLVYKKATALEVLVAHLYLSEPARCLALVDALLCGQGHETAQ